MACEDVPEEVKYKPGAKSKNKQNMFDPSFSRPMFLFWRLFIFCKHMGNAKSNT
jgi:hypothetical protein